uniref:Histone H4 n=1 Tax=Triticum urartu TaxID=4572 RepID=A0A8R7K3Y4_TRIUA
MSGRGKGGKGLGKGGAKRHRKVLREHPGHHQAGDPEARSEGRREAHLGAHLRGDPRRAQDLPRERHPRRRHLHTEHARRKTVTAMDVVYALKRQGRTLYGFGG